MNIGTVTVLSVPMAAACTTPDCKFIFVFLGVLPVMTVVPRSFFANVNKDKNS
jgi:hypothetical protein